MTPEQIRLPIRPRRTQHFLLLTKPTELTIVSTEIAEGYLAEITIPRRAGVYGYNSIEARDKAVVRYNRSNGLEEVARPVLLQGL